MTPSRSRKNNIGKLSIKLKIKKMLLTRKWKRSEKSLNRQTRRKMKPWPMLLKFKSKLKASMRNSMPCTPKKMKNVRHTGKHATISRFKERRSCTLSGCSVKKRKLSDKVNSSKSVKKRERLQSRACLILFQRS